VTGSNWPAAIAGRWNAQSRQTRLKWIAALAVSLALLLLPWIVRLDGKQHADWEQFLGRFHPLIVHLPIGLVVLVPVLEIAGAIRPALREAAAFVLLLALPVCVASLILGFLLAFGGGEAGDAVTRHMWGGIALCIGVLICFLARPAWSASGARAYPVALAATLLALVWTAHQGASITHGGDYLTEYMPGPIKRALAIGVVSAAPATDSFYAQHIDPIFDRNCVSCHGASKIQGGLRLDSYARLMRGGKDGRVIAEGKPEQSLLLQRVTLPRENKHFMPAEGHTPLSQQQIDWITAWVRQGASPTVATLKGVSVPVLPKEPPIQPVADYSALMGDIRAMQKGLGAKLEPVSSKLSDGLVLRTADVAPSFGDAQLAQLQKFAPYIVEAELGRTAVTDASLDTLSHFTHLRALHLEDTAITGNGLAKLTTLSQLTYLNLSGTKVTSSSVSPLASMKGLRHVYLFDTPAQPVAQTEPAPSK
jgi:mono/diheme cytochrome c family protein